jgi:hypothetical protein
MARPWNAIDTCPIRVTVAAGVRPGVPCFLVFVVEAMLTQAERLCCHPGLEEAVGL